MVGQVSFLLPTRRSIWLKQDLMDADGRTDGRTLPAGQFANFHQGIKSFGGNAVSAVPKAQLAHRPFAGLERKWIDLFLCCKPQIK